MPSSLKHSANHEPLALPALRGTFGDWTYYSTVVPMPELAQRVSFADDIHTNTALSSWIQRSLKGNRAGDIAEYLRTQPERFFNSLVIALYGGTPQWVPVKLPPLSKDGPDLGPAADVLGVLQLGGGEKLFAVDGQHRLAGMKRFLEESAAAPKKLGQSTAADDLVSILVVAHRVDRKIRTRRLFTTLNKTAVPVSKMERIALDENDVMAITVRRLVEDHAWFQSPRIAMQHTNNLGRDENVALTTIGNLYDVLRVLFLATSGAKKKELEFVRPSDASLDSYYEQAVDFFEALGKVEPGLAKYFTSEEPASVCSGFRRSDGGSVYFRPLGLSLMTEVAMSLKASKGDAWQAWLAALPKKLEVGPFAGTIWSQRGTIEPKHKVLCRDILYYMCGLGHATPTALRERLQEVTGDGEASLPRKVRP
jgi:DNA sulfur modification protein DndB